MDKRLFGDENKTYETEGELKFKQPSELLGNAFNNLKNSAYEINLKLSGEEANKLFKTFALIARKREKERMYELVSKYNHIKKALILNLEIPKIGRCEFVVSNSIKEMFLMENIIYITPDENKALKDWIKVLNGCSPLS